MMMDWLRGVTTPSGSGQVQCFCCGEFIGMNSSGVEVKQHLLDVEKCCFLLSRRAEELGRTEPSVAEALRDGMVQCIKSILGADRVHLFGDPPSAGSVAMIRPGACMVKTPGAVVAAVPPQRRLSPSIEYALLVPDRCVVPDADADAATTAMARTRAMDAARPSASASASASVRRLRHGYSAIVVSGAATGAAVLSAVAAAARPASEARRCELSSRARAAGARLAKTLAKRRPGWYRIRAGGLVRLAERHQRDVEDAHERGLCRARVDFVDEPGHPCHGGRCARPVGAMPRAPTLLGDYAFGGRASVDARAADPERPTPFVKGINTFLFDCAAVGGQPALLIEPDTTRALSAINDARGTGRDPNAQAVDVVHSDGRRTIAVFTRKKVGPDEELTIDYGPLYWGFHGAMAAEWARALAR